MNFNNKNCLLSKTKPWTQDLEMEKDCEINQDTMSYILWKGISLKPFAIWFVQDCANDWTMCQKLHCFGTWQFCSSIVDESWIVLFVA
jgi:hypothetical protein